MSPALAAAAAAQAIRPHSGRAGEVAEDVLDHDHRGVDDQAEIDRADRQQVRRFAAQHHDVIAKHKRERDGRGDDDGAAQIAEEHPLHEEDQHDAEQHIVQHGVGRHLDQVAAVVDLFDTHSGRQDAAAIDFLDFGLDPCQSSAGSARRDA